MTIVEPVLLRPASRGATPRSFSANSLFKSVSKASVAAFEELTTIISSTYMSINIVIFDL